MLPAAHRVEVCRVSSGKAVEVNCSRPAFVLFYIFHSFFAIHTPIAAPTVLNSTSLTSAIPLPIAYCISSQKLILPLFSKLTPHRLIHHTCVALYIFNHLVRYILIHIIWYDSDSFPQPHPPPATITSHRCRRG